MGGRKQKPKRPRKKSRPAVSELGRLKQKLQDLIRENASLRRSKADLERRYARLLDEIRELAARRATSRKGVTPDDQLLLDFVHELAEVAGAALALTTSDTTAESSASSESDGVASEPDTDAAKPRTKPGRRKLSEDLPRVRSEYTLPEDERMCLCNKPMPEIGETTSEELGRICIMFVHEHARKKYACNRCDCAVLVAPGPERILPKSMAGPSMLSWVISSKFGEHLPYYRLEKMLAREGAPVSRATLGNWVLACSDLLEPVADEIRRSILARPYLQTDDTSKMIQKGREDGGRFGHYWVYTNPQGEVSYDFTETRSRDGPMCVLKDFEGYVQADAYSGYDEVFRVSGAKEVGCWAHAKRKFDDAKETDPESAGQALAAIRKLYDIESKATQEQSSPDRRRDLRQRDARPILDVLKDWLDAEALRVQQRSPIDKAVGYVLNQWDALTRYLEDGRLEIDNNRAERMMKPVAIGRKNDLFVYSTETGKKAAIIMSIVESCKAIDLDPAIYLCDVLQELRQNPEPNIADLVPAAWQARHNEDAQRKAVRAAAVAKVAEAILAAR